MRRILSLAIRSILALGTLALIVTAMNARGFGDFLERQAIAVAEVPTSKSCTPMDFTIGKFQVAVTDKCTASSCKRLKFTGALHNNCSVPAGGKIRIAAYDKAGAVVDTMEFWPSSTQNIASGGSYPFSVGASMDYDARMATFDWEIVATHIWR